MHFPALSVILASGLLAACATSSRDGRLQLVADPKLSAVYSEVDMRVKLAATADAPADGRQDGPCAPQMVCDTRPEFERKVVEIGKQLAKAAHGQFPGLDERVAKFDFAVAGKAEAGTFSSAGGAIVVLDGVRRLGLSDEALSFVIAREMGHVIGRHHDENSATSMIFSVAAALLLPVANLIRGAEVVLTSGTAISATTTAASLAGSSIVRASYRGDQVREADAIAMQLLADEGHELHDVAAALDADSLRGEDKWLEELRGSYRRVEQLACGPRRTLRGSDVELTMSMSLAPVE
jgi:predicted Zn-dependent protease